jgi:hypothetical protein
MAFSIAKYKSIYIYIYIYIYIHIKDIKISCFTMSSIYIQDISGLRVKDKGQAIPLQAWIGPESSRMLRLPDFKTFGL